METRTAFNRHIQRDLVVIALSIIVAVVAVKTGFLQDLFQTDLKGTYVGAFIAGVMFTSLFTTPIAIAMFITLIPEMNIFAMVGIGACGALLGDLALFTLIRHSFKDDVEYLLHRPSYKQFAAIFRRRTFRWVIPFIGGLIIVIPILPDELGVGLMGVSNMKLQNLILISLTMNIIGIFLLTLIV